MRFEFATAGRIIFGPGAVCDVGRIAAELAGLRHDGAALAPAERGVAAQAGDARRALVVTGRSRERSSPLLDALEPEEFELALLSVAEEPTVALVESGVALAREHAAGIVIAFGGGSALDTGKAVAALATNPGEVLDYLEVIGRNRPLKQPPLPFIAIPTTAGTGSEVTRNAVLASPEHAVKVSLRSPLMLPRVALVDPELTYDLPPAVTASTGLDALTQLIEPFVSARANPMTDAICREGIMLAARSLRRVYRDGRDAEAREDMSLASLFGGMALANAGLGAVHGFAGPIGGMFHAPHGAICAALLPHVMAVNLKALRDRTPDSPALERYHEVAALLTGDPQAAAESGVDWVRQLCRDLAIPPLRTYRITQNDFERIIPKAQAASSMKGNPVALEASELEEILGAAV